MLATALFLSCILFWIVLFIAVTKMGLIGALIVIIAFFLASAAMISCITSINERNKKGGKKNE